MLEGHDHEHIDRQDINEDELRYLKSWLEEDVEHKSYFFELKGISDSSRRSFFSKEGLNETSWQKMYARIEKLQEKEPSRDKLRVRNLWISWVKYAAIVILAVGLGWGIHAFYGKVESSYLAEENVVYTVISCLFNFTTKGFSSFLVTSK